MRESLTPTQPSGGEVLPLWATEECDSAARQELEKVKREKVKRMRESSTPTQPSGGEVLPLWAIMDLGGEKGGETGESLPFNDHEAEASPASPATS